MSLSCNTLRTVLFWLFLINCSSVSAQKEFSVWYFGINNGIDFRSGTPVATTNPNFGMAETEGVTTVSDANGDLLFYSDGEVVYNNQHNPMLHNHLQAVVLILRP